MARPPLYDSAAFLDAALGLAADGGPAAVTMAAVAKSAGAPSGSVYHRFADRPALLSALWLRTLEDFQTGFLAALAEPAPADAALGAARHTVAWSRAHPRGARVLRYGADDFGRTTWPAAATERLHAANALVAGAVRELSVRLGAEGPGAAERVSVAVVDLPYALVQRHLRTGGEVPEEALTAVEEYVAALLPHGARPAPRSAPQPTPSPYGPPEPSPQPRDSAPPSRPPSEPHG